MPLHLIVADNNPRRTKELTSRLTTWNYPHSVVHTEDDLWKCLAVNPQAIVLLGFVDSHTILPRLLNRGHRSVLVLLNGHADVHDAGRVIKQGASDAFADPIDFVCVRQSLETIIAKYLQHSRVDDPLRPPMVGRGSAFEDVRRSIREVAATDATVLILGESGTGKELVAREIHEASQRARGPYLPVNMAALPETLAEGALFGHRRGAFTGAERDQVGWCEGAHGGTLFLDEIGDLDLGLQAKLLRFLESKTFQRIGATEVTRVDVRIIAATNRDPMELIKQGKMRTDLFYRLNVFPIQLPTLWQRADDIPELANLFLFQAGRQYGKAGLTMTDEVMHCLRRFNWPGNIRQLENTIHRMVIGCRGERLNVTHLPKEIAAMRHSTGSKANLRKIEQIEREAILDALDSAGGNAVAAAKILGVGQATVYRKIKRYGINLKQGRKKLTE